MRANVQARHSKNQTHLGSAGKMSLVKTLDYEEEGREFTTRKTQPGEL